MKIKLLILISSLTILASCSHIPTQAKLKLPPELVIPEKLRIAEHEWRCLGKEKFWECPAFQKLGKRDKLKDARIETLRNIIKATH